MSSDAIGYKVTEVSFKTFSEQQIKKMSVCKVTQTQAFDDLGHPIRGGLHDPLLGPMEPRERCETCGLLGTQCPGHTGHLELPVFCFHPMFFAKLYQLLRASCLHCHQINSTQAEIAVLVTQLKLLSSKNIMLAKEIESVLEFHADDYQSVLASALSRAKRDAGANTSSPAATSSEKSIHVAKYEHQVIEKFLAGCSKVSRCPHCKVVARKWAQENSIKVFVQALSAKARGKEATRRGVIEGYAQPDSRWYDRIYVTPDNARQHILEMYAHHRELLNLLFGSRIHKKATRTTVRKFDANMFFIRTILVSPSRFRPPHFMNGQSFENERTVALSTILKHATRMVNIGTEVRDADGDDEDEYKKRYTQRMTAAWHALQESVNVFMDSSLSTQVADSSRGIRQGLERKEGLFRLNMMGKRVNFAARTVISPDPMIGTHEIGVPMVFASKLTFPQQVTFWNMKYLRQCVINGPDTYPGATHIENEDGRLIALSIGKERRQAIADQLLTPQGRDESKCKAKVVYRHIKNGDWVLMNRQPTLHKSSIMAHQVRVLPGERTFRMHYANCKTYNADFDGDEMNMHVPQSHLARAEAANIASNTFQYIGLGGSPLRGLIQDHVVALTRICSRDTFYDRHHYHSLVYQSLEDSDINAVTRIITVPPAMIKPDMLWTGKQVITTIIKNITQGYCGLNISGKAKIKNSWTAAKSGLEGDSTVLVRDDALLMGLLDKSQCGASKKGIVHSYYEAHGGEIAAQLLTALGKLGTILLKYHGQSLAVDDLILTPAADARRRATIENTLDEGPKAAARFVNQEDYRESSLLRENIATILHDPIEHKGLDSVMASAANKIQSEITASKNIPNGLIKSFPWNNFQMIVQSGAKGSNVNATQISGLLGQQMLEGRRVPVMPSGKSLPSFPAFDASLRSGGLITDRFLTGLRPQEYYFHCMAGREGLVDTAVKTSRSGYLQRCLVKHLEDLRIHYDMTVRDADGSVIQFRYGEDSLDVTKVAALTSFDFMAKNYTAFLERFDAANAVQAFPGKTATIAPKLLRKTLKDPTAHDPVLATLRPDTYFGCVSEKFYKQVQEYIDSTLRGNNASPEVLPDDKKFRQLMFLKSHNALADPGEAVGIIAAQAVGEPSTQMTLNTFHFAGRGDVNVTLGIPRLREIIMTAGQTKTPLIKVPLRKGEETLLSAKQLASSLTPVTLKDVLKSLHVSYWLAPTNEGRVRRYHFRFQFLPSDEYQEKCAITPEDLLTTLETVFFGEGLKRIAFNWKKRRGATSGIESVAVGRPQAGADVSDADYKGASGKSDADNDIVSSDVTGNDMDEADMTKGKASKRRLGSRSRMRKSGTTDDGELVDTSDEEDDDDDGNDDDENSEDSDNEDARAGVDEGRGDISSDSDGERDRDASKMDEGVDDFAEVESLPTAKQQISVEKQKRINNILGETLIHSYDYDDARGEWADVTLSLPISFPIVPFVTIIEESAHRIKIRETKDISRCSVVKSNQDLEVEDTFLIEGLNLLKASEHYELFDLNKLECNDIISVYNTYGVEAARESIIRELVAVFGVYGIEVNFRHLSVIADYMTFEGTFRGMNRISMRSNVSPFTQMSFESTVDFLKRAVIEGDHDTLKSNSARLVVGNLTVNGTGGFDLLQPLDQYLDEE